MPVDASIFNNVHTYQDYDMARQQFLAQQQAAQLDAATKASVLKGQLIGGAAGTGDPMAIAAAKQHGASLGIDMSDVPDDPQGAVNYANSLINAQKPYALGNAIANAVRTNAAGTTAVGSVAEAQSSGLSVPVPYSGAIKLPGGVQPPPQITLPQPTPQTPAPTQGAFINALRTPIPTGQPTPAPAPQPTNAADPSGLLGLSVPPQPIKNDNVSIPTPQPATAPQSAPIVSSAPTQPVKEAGETPANFNARLSAWQALPEVKATDVAATKAAETRAESINKQIDSNLSAKDILRLYHKIGTEAPGVPGGIAQNVGANLANAANIPSDAANNRGAFDADINNLYLATIRSLAGTGRVQKAELIKIGEASPQQNDPTGVKISKVNAHLEDYNKRMMDMGFNPSTGKQLAAGEQPVPVPPVPMPGKQADGASQYKPGMTQTSKTGTYLFNGGDPSDKSNWKKIK